MLIIIEASMLARHGLQCKPFAKPGAGRRSNHSKKRT